MVGKTTEERRKRLFEIYEQISQLNKEADGLLDGKSLPAQTNTGVPEDFNLKETVKAMVAAKKKGIQKQQIIKAIKASLNVDLSPGQVHNTLAYLKKKGEIESAGYGRYKVKAQ